MAKFTATAPLNIRLPGGFEVSGAAGTTHRIPDSLYEEFARDQVPLIPGGVTWITQDETSAIVGFDPSTKYDKTGGTISGAIAATGAISGASLSAVGAIAGASASVTGALSASTIIAAAVTATSAFFRGSPWYDVKAYGALGDGTTDDTAAVQAAITAAFNAPGGIVAFPAGTYKITSTLVTPNSTAGAVTLRGMGRPRSFTGGVNGDPSAGQGTVLSYSASTGSIFQASMTSASKRQYIIFESLYFQGNTAGASGHGIHLQSTLTTSAVIPTFRDVTVNGAKQHGVFFDGNVFEAQFYNVRLTQNGDRGFKAAVNGSALPGETRFYGCSINANATGIDLAGGGQFSFHGLTASNNSAEALVANGVGLTVYEGNVEQNGTTTGNQITLTSVTRAHFIGLNMTVKTGSTGNGVSFVSCLWCRITGYSANASTAGAGYKDFRFDSGTSRCTVDDYAADDFTDRYAVSTGGGHQIRRGASWLSYQTHAQQTISCSATTTAQPDATLYDSFIVTSTTTGITVTMAAPTVYATYHAGQRISFTVFNNTAGTLTVTWAATYHLAGAWTNPAAGKTRTITFEWDNTRSAWYELNRAAADIT